MKIYAWSLLLLPLVFAIGWTTHVLAEGRTARVSESPPETHGKERYNRPGRTRGPGMFARTVEDLSDEIGLTEEQRERFHAIVEQTSVDVEQLESEMESIHDQARTEIHALLSESQVGQLVELMERGMESYREEKLQRSLDWMAANADLDEGQLNQAAQIFQGYSERWTEAMRHAFQSGVWPDRQQMEQQCTQWRDERDQQLRELLSVEELEQYQAEFSRSRSSAHDRRSETRGGEGN